MAVAVHVHRRLAAGLRQQPVEGQGAAADQLERGIEQLAQRPSRPVRRPVVRAAVRPVLGQVVSAVERCHAVAVEPAEQVGHGHARHDRLQRRVPGGDRRPLGVAVVGVAPHADVAVRPGLLRDPLDRVVAVVDLVHERVHLAPRPELAAHVLGQERVAALGEVARDERHPAVAAVLVVGQPHQHRRPRALPVRQVDVGGQLDAVAHRRHVLLGARVERGRLERLDLDRHRRGSLPQAVSNTATSGREATASSSGYS